MSIRTGVWILTLVLAAAAVGLHASSGLADSGLLLGVRLAAGLAFVGTGASLWTRPSQRRTAALLAATGLVTFLGALTEASEPALQTAGLIAGSIVFCLLVHAGLAHPTGRLEHRFDRVQVALAYSLIPAGLVLAMLFSRARELPCAAGCAEDTLTVDGDAAVGGAIRVSWHVLTIAIALVAAIRLTRGPKARSPVQIATAAAVAGVAAAFALTAATNTADEGLEAAVLGLPIVVPVAHLVGLLRSRLARVAAARLLIEVPEDPTPEQVQAELRRVLRDPTLRLALWLPETDGYVDAEGRPFELPPDSPTSVTTTIDYEDRPVAALVHDADLLGEPELLEEVCAAARLGLEKDRSLRALRASELRNRAVLDAIPDLMFRISADGTYLDYKAGSERELLTPDVIGLTVHDRLPPLHADLILGAGRDALQDSDVHAIEYELELGGDLRFYEGRITASGEDEFLFIVRDITERRRQQEALQLERDLLRTVVNTAPTFFIGVQPDGSIIRFNSALERLSGLADDDEIRGRAFWDVFLADADAADAERCFREATSGSPGEFEHTWRDSEGGTAVVAWTASWYPGEGGDDRFLIAGTDVTERHRQAAELERERAFLNAIANNAPSMLCLIDSEGRVPDRATNISFEKLLEHDPAETGGHIFWERYVHPDDADEARSRIERVIAGELLGEHDSRWLTSGGQSLLVAWSCTELPRLDERHLFLISGVDITERKRQEEEIRQSRARIVEAGDAERRRLERNLHDGAQQRLVAISISLRVARAKLGAEAGEAEKLIEGATEELARALQELRELARGLHPAILTDRGLHPALAGLAARSPVPVELDVSEARMPPPVEAAAYYVVSEALANVAKYAQASAVSVRVTHDDGRVVVEVADDGVGGADPGLGSGLRGLADRVEALDGRLHVASHANAGTRVLAEIPLAGADLAVEIPTE